MSTLVDFIIPVKGLKYGMHHYQFSLDQVFFEAFENAPIQAAQFEVLMDLDKRENMMVLSFTMNGFVHDACDRCLEMIDVPVSTNEQLIVRLSNTDDADDDPNIVRMDPETHELDVSGFIYEFICLALPISHVYDCENDPDPKCNEEVLDRLNEASTDTSNPFHDALKDIKQKFDI